MIRGMITDMTHNSALITNAMLASYANEKDITYIQMIEPFIMYSFPTRIGAKIDISKVVKSVYDNFGLDIKSKVVEKILLNLSKDTSGSKVQYNKNKSKFTFYVNEKVDTTEFDKRRNYMKSLVVNVVKSLKDFINDEENIIKKIGEKEAENILIDFLKTYNASTYENIENVEKIQFQDGISKNNYKVARFIIREYQNELGCFDEIKQIQEGFFASTALYGFFEDIDNIDKNNSLKDTVVVLDTMLLVDALKLDTDYKSNSMEELLILIQKNGGVLYTFDYYIEEVCNIIEKYLFDPDSRISLDLDSYRRGNINTAEIALQLKNLRDNAENLLPIKLSYNNLEINILSNIFYSDLIEKESWHIDYLQLEKMLGSRISYSSPQAFENDCKTIEYILYENTVQSHNVIFLSSNSDLIFVAKDFVEKQYKKLFSTDIDLTAKIWLSNYNAKGKLTELALLQNAYAALNPDKEILKDVLRIIDNNINSSDEKLKSDALLLRYDDNLRHYISSVVKNDKNNVNLMTQENLKNLMRKEIRLEVEAEKEIEERKENKQLKTSTYQNKKKKEQLEKREKNIKAREYQMQYLYDEISATTEQLETKNKELNNIKNITKNRFKKFSSICCITLIILLGIIFSYLIFIIMYNLTVFCFINLLKNNCINNTYQICTLISFIITASSILLAYFKFLKKIYKICHNKLYSFLCKHSKIL